MLKTLLSLALLAGTYAAASTTPTLYITDLKINAETQSVTVSAITALDLPEGERALSATVNCTRHPAVDVTVWKEQGNRWEEDTAALDRLTASGVARRTTASVHLRGTSGTLGFFCKNAVLYTDFSGMNGDPSSSIDLSDAPAHFLFSQSPLRTEYPLLSTLEADGQFSLSSLTMEFEGRHGWSGPKVLRTAQIQNLPAHTNQQAFLYDPAHHVLLPLSSGSKPLGTVQVNDRIDVYYTADRSRAGKWYRLRYDFKAALISVQSASLPVHAAVRK